MKRALLGAAFVALLASSARADDRAACVQSADRGQELRDKGKLTSARAEFTDCSRASCPALVTKQCTEWLAEIAHDMPTVSFRALDPAGKELLDVTVYVDSLERKGSLDGQPIEVDPGVHTFRFVHAGSPDVLLQAVVRPKERDRIIDAKFTTAAKEAPPEHHHAFRFPAFASASFAIGIMSFIGMAVLVGTAANDASSLRSHCAGSCAQSDVDWINTRIVLGNVAMGVGIAGISAFALTLLIANVTAHDDDPKSQAPAVSFGVGPGSIGFAGRF